MRISDWSSDVCSSDLVYVQPVTAVQPIVVSAPIPVVTPVATTYLPSEPPRVAPSSVRTTPSHVHQSQQSIRQGSSAAKKPPRSEERRVGKECVRTVCSRWSTYL